VDYAYDTAGSTVDPAWDGTYAGAVVREFAIEATQGVLVTTEEDAIFKVTLGAIAKYPGYYAANDGFLDDAIYIQDSRYYQVFSYVLRIDERLASYKSAVKTMVHPAGTALFGEFEIQNYFDVSIALENLIKILALSLSDSASLTDDLIVFDIDKVVVDSTTMTESLTYSILKALTDSISTPSDSLTILTGKALTDSIDTPTESITAKDIGKALTDSLTTPTESITAKDIDKALTDSLTTPSDSILLATTKYLQDSNIGTLSDSGYVAQNPYSSDYYFAITPIYYNDEVKQTF
jgi:hypothetical protein